MNFADDAAMKIRSTVATFIERPCANFQDAMFHMRKLGAEPQVLKPCMAIGAVTDFKRRYSPAVVEQVVAEVQNFLVEQKNTINSKSDVEKRTAEQKIGVEHNVVAQGGSNEECIFVQKGSDEHIHNLQCANTAEKNTADAATQKDL